MFGYQRYAVQNIDIPSASTFSPAAEIEGAVAIFLQVNTSNTAANYTICGADTASTAQMLPIYYNSYSGGVVPVFLSTGASGYFVNISQAHGLKYLKVQASIAMVDGSKMSVYTAQ